MKKLLLLLLPIFLLTNMNVKQAEKINVNEHKEARLYDKFLNGDIRTAYVFTYDLQQPYHIIARMYKDDIEQKNLKTSLREIQPGKHQLYLSLNAKDAEFVLYNKGNTGRVSFPMIGPRSGYTKAFSDITYIRKSEKAIEGDSVPLLTGQYKEDGHTYQFTVQLEKNK